MKVFAVIYLRSSWHLDVTCPCDPVSKTLGRHVQ